MSDDEHDSAAAAANATSGATNVERQRPLMAEDFDNDRDSDVSGCRRRPSSTVANGEELLPLTLLHDGRIPPQVYSDDGQLSGSLSTRKKSTSDSTAGLTVPDAGQRGVADQCQVALQSAAASSMQNEGEVVATTSFADAEAGEEGTSGLPYPGFADRAFFLLDQTTRPRSWCLRAITWPYPFNYKFALCS
jgi:hypothetical protein